MQLSLEGQIALVTGSSRGIGRGIALALAEAGSDVVVNYKSDDASAKETAKRIQIIGRKAVAIQADVTDYVQVQAMVRQSIEELGGIDILVNNAGIASSGKFVADTEVDELHKLINTHVFGAFHCTQAVLPNMRKQRRGNIILISSTATTTFNAGSAPYTMAKMAMEALVKTLAKEERVFGIRANVIAPSLANTDMTRQLMKRKGINDIDQLNIQAPFERIVRPDDVGKLCVFLVSDYASYITGQVILVNGGG
jgi:NAD(P)-dependent dehydrogenase (short-subunit alcohol dehydrogenase family)